MAVTDLWPAALWLGPFFLLIRLGRRRPHLDLTRGRSDVLISVIVPARNEGANIPRLLASLTATTYHPIEILVVDDRSEDDTGARVAEAAAHDARIRLVNGESLPPGWFGKPWACVQGYRQAAGSVLLFTDADTTHAPDLLAAARGAQVDTGADLLTVAPLQRCESLWERIVMPQVWVLVGARYHPSAVNRARRIQDVIANGQFILVTRDSYEAIGTHEAVCGEVAEDLALAQAYARAGRTIHFAFADRLMETRMYTDLRGLVEGWSKNLYLGARRSLVEFGMLKPLIPLMYFTFGAFWLVPPAILLGAIAGGGAPPGWTLVAVGLSLSFWTIIMTGMRIPVWYALCYPLGAVMFLIIAARSVIRGRRRIEWRGRRYTVAREDEGSR